MQYRVLDRIKNNLDILRVHRCGEVMVQPPSRVPGHAREHTQDERLHVLHGVRVASELGEVPAYVRLRIGHLLLQQIVLVQEQDDGHALEDPIVDDRVEYVA